MASMERLRKIYELSVRGIDGERENAQRKLAELLEKHDLTFEDLIGDERHKHVFTYKNNHEMNLLYAIVSKVLNSADIPAWKQSGKRKNIVFSLTAAEYVEVTLLYSEYRAAFEAETKNLLTAFIVRNNIYRTDRDDERPERTLEEKLEIKRILEMALALNKVPIDRKRITAAD